RWAHVGRDRPKPAPPALANDGTARKLRGHVPAFLAASEQRPEARFPGQDHDAANSGRHELAAADLAIALPEKPGTMALERLLRRRMALQARQPGAKSARIAAALVDRHPAQPALARLAAGGDIARCRSHDRLLVTWINSPPHGGEQGSERR